MDREQLKNELRDLAARCEQGGQSATAGVLYSLMGSLANKREADLLRYLQPWNVAELASLYNRHGSRN